MRTTPAEQEQAST